MDQFPHSLQVSQSRRAGPPKKGHAKSREASDSPEGSSQEFKGKQNAFSQHEPSDSDSDLDSQAKADQEKEVTTIFLPCQECSVAEHHEDGGCKKQ